MTAWENIWKNKDAIQTSSLKQLLIQSGFWGNGINEENWVDHINSIALQLNIKKETSIFDFGCGCGAFTFPLPRYTSNISGIDISPSFIQNITKVFSNFTHGNFLDLNISQKFDIILSNSVFQYLNTVDNATKIMNKMLSIGNDKAKIVILDINNIEKQEEYNAERANSMNLTLEEYQERYKGLEHLFFSKEFFEKFAERNNLRIEIFNQNIKHYGNNKFRFNVIMEKI